VGLEETIDQRPKDENRGAGQRPDGKYGNRALAKQITRAGPIAATEDLRQVTQ